jgi:hypothetical protein
MVTKLGFESLLRNHIDWPAQEVLKVEDETCRKPRTRGRPDINEDIDIAFGAGLATCDGTKDPDIVCSVSGGDSLDFVAFCVQKLLKHHSLPLSTGSILKHSDIQADVVIPTYPWPPEPNL